MFNIFLYFLFVIFDAFLCFLWLQGFLNAATLANQPSAAAEAFQTGSGVHIVYARPSAALWDAKPQSVSEAQTTSGDANEPWAAGQSPGLWCS